MQPNLNLRFDTFIARGNCLLSVEAVRRHPNVRGVISLPRNWILYEFHHELFQEPDFLVEGIWQQKMQQSPVLRQSRIDMLNEERALLAPWYARKRKIGDADGFLSSEICTYRVATLSPMKWIDYDLPPGWGLADAFTIVLEHGNDSARGAALEQLLNDWRGASNGTLSIPARLESAAGRFTVGAFCKENSGHWLAALWVLLSDPRSKAGVRKATVTIEQR